MSSVLIGQIVNVHGIKGEVKIYPYTDDVENLAMKLKKIYLDEAMKQGSYKISWRKQNSARYFQQKKQECRTWAEN